ncbi:hypothetical protein ElyMa_003269800 [Elysia marginata]|uniref:Uncharacterized protein n=1 Tax=Elysia marginata TaxID=1093978 RepID=A0AAV4JBG4_9GAST|nr:hypothetical protein ElyMa_003269800 [Elysia marginata]
MNGVATNRHPLQESKKSFSRREIREEDNATGIASKAEGAVKTGTSAVTKSWAETGRGRAARSSRAHHLLALFDVNRQDQAELNSTSASLQQHTGRSRFSAS